MWRVPVRLNLPGNRQVLAVVEVENCRPRRPLLSELTSEERARPGRLPLTSPPDKRSYGGGTGVDNLLSMLASAGPERLKHSGIRDESVERQSQTVNRRRLHKQPTWAACLWQAPGLVADYDTPTKNGFNSDTPESFILGRHENHVNPLKSPGQGVLIKFWYPQHAVSIGGLSKTRLYLILERAASNDLEVQL